MSRCWVADWRAMRGVRRVPPGSGRCAPAADPAGAAGWGRRAPGRPRRSRGSPLSRRNYAGIYLHMSTAIREAMDCGQTLPPVRRPEAGNDRPSHSASSSRTVDEMKHINLGDLDVARIGLGAMGMSAAYTGAGTDDAESIRTIHRALDLGVTLIDTAEIYGPYINEELVGRAHQGPPRRGRARHQVRPGLPRRRRPRSARQQPGRTSAPPSRARCKRLGTDHIDLYYQHRVDPDTPIEDTVGALAELVAEGKIRHIGLSEARRRHDPPRARRAPDHRAAVGVLAVDPRPRGRGAAGAARAGHRLRRRTRRWAAASSPGTITSTDDFDDSDFRKTNPRFDGRELRAATCASSTRSRRSPTEVGATPAQVALAWLLAQGDDIAPIPGTKRVVAGRGERRRRRRRADRRAAPEADRRVPRRGRPPQRGADEEDRPLSPRSVRWTR